MARMARPRRTRENLRQELVNAALVEFAAKGFDGASTRVIAERVDAHQPQINYHFSSKEALWEAAVDHLFSLLDDAFADLTPPDEIDDPVRLGELVAEMLRRFVRFAAEHPELNRIIVQEATQDSDRLHNLVERHVRPWYEGTVAAWSRLRDAGIAAPIEPANVHWVIVGFASIPFVNAPEVRLLAGVEPTKAGWVDSHADTVVATMLPGLKRRPRARRSPASKSKH